MDLRNFTPLPIPAKMVQLSMLNKNMKHLKEMILKCKMIILKVYGLKLRTKIKNIVCGCIYIHPNHDTSEFNNYLDVTLKKLSRENKEVYICGDFNIRLT